MKAAFLPVTREEMLERGWDRVDFVYVSGDAYVDHPSFGMAIITRLLEANGYKVGVIAQPDWNDPESVAVFGEPRLAFLVSAGNMDSMVNHYTVAKKRRRSDAYSPGGEAGRRPNHAAVVYGNLIRRTFKKTPLILGGIEASLRRLSHYDYWSDKLKRSILLDSGADLVSYGMGEHSIIEIADALNAGLAIEDLTFIDGTVYRAASLEHVYDAVTLPSFPAVRMTSWSTRAASPCSTRTVIPSLASASWSRIPTTSSSCRTRRPRRSRKARWTPCTDCRTRARTTRCTRRPAACPPSAR